MRRYVIAVLLASAFLTCSLPAQNFQGGLGFIVGAPQGEFKDNLDATGYGITGHIGYSPKTQPLMIGVEFGYMNYGSETRTEPFSTTIPDVFVNVTTTNNLVLTHLFLRVQPSRGIIRPYLEGLVGFSYFFTETKIENKNRSGEEIASNTNQDDATFSGGGGLGAMVQVYSKDKDNRKIEVLLDFRTRYLLGGEAEYLKKGSIRRESGRVVYDINRSKTNLLTFQFGVAVRF
jgi:hypothetical protein